MKGQLSVDPTFRPLSIKKPIIHLRNPLIAYDGHRLHFSNKSVSWEQKAIINCTYSPKLDVVMVLCSDWKLYIYNRNLDQIARLSDWQSKYSVGFEYVQSLNTFLLIGVIEIELLKVNIRTNLKETKFLSSIKFGIERKEMRSVEQKNRLTWNKGYGYDIQQNLLYVWSTQNINFYSLNKLELQSSIVKLVKKETAITQVLLNRSYKYTITGLFNGNLKVWRLPLSPISQNSEYIMIHNCTYHTRPIEKIVQASDYRLVLSSSQDLTLCLWSLETFELLRAYNFQGQYTDLFLIDQKRAFAVQNGQLGELVFGKTMDFIMEIDSPITFFDKAISNGSWSSFQITLEANVGIQIRKDQLRKKDLNKMQIGFFYPPLKAQSIRQILASPFDDTLYYMLVERGQLYSLRFEQNSSKIQHAFAIHHALDSESHSLNQNPTFITFLQLPDLRFDSQITEGTLSHRPSTEQNNQPASRQLKLITIGCSKGSIIILSLNQIERIRSRLTYHRESILLIQVVHQQGCGYTLASYCAEDYLRLISLQNGKAQCFFNIHCASVLKFMRSFEDKLILVFKKGIFQIATAKDSQQFHILQNLDSVDHEGEIYSVDIQPYKRLIMTGGSDNRIKIWSTFKQLVYQIKLDEGLRYAIWSIQLQIFVAHRNKLLYLRDFTIDTISIDEQKKNETNKIRLTEIGLKQYFIAIKKDTISSKHKGQQYEQVLMKKQKGKTLSLIQHKQRESVNQFKQTGNNFILSECPTQPQRERKNSANSKQKTTKLKGKSFTMNIRQEEQSKKKANLDARLKATQKHIEELNSIKKMTNNSLLPKISAKHEDKFEEFINAKLINKKMLTRRDITLNRIIMKNLIRQQFSQQQEDINNIKLDF